MKKAILLSLVILGGLTAALPASAKACSRPSVAGSDKVIVPGKRINEALLDAAVRVEVNYYRCRAGLRPVRSEPRLRKIAKGHSKWMARARNMSHHSTVSGRRTFGDRIKASGIRWKAAAENIGMVYRFRMEQKLFFSEAGATCQFTNSAGQRIPPHSYKSLANYVVKLWMNSPGHRKNILDRRMTMVGTAVAL
ncbi:MAG TPA: CAP domain-containing protein, partial [Rhodobacteraceae bacterium]|nr:CAP domain-containing protein [Paracoccaceae bacterium]